MKFAPTPSMSPTLLDSQSVQTAIYGYTVKLEAVADPKTGQSYLALAVGTSRRATRVWLTAAQADELIRNATELTTIL